MAPSSNSQKRKCQKIWSIYSLRSKRHSFSAGVLAVSMSSTLRLKSRSPSPTFGGHSSLVRCLSHPFPDDPITLSSFNMLRTTTSDPLAGSSAQGSSSASITSFTRKDRYLRMPSLQL